MWAAWARAPRINKRFALAIAAKLLRAVRRVNILHLIVLAVLQDSALLATLYVRKEDRLQRRVQNSLSPDCTDLSAAPRSGVDRRRPAAQSYPIVSNQQTRARHHHRRRSRPPKRKHPMAAMNSVCVLSIEGEVALVTINSPPVNALSQAVREGLKRGVEAAEANGAVKAIVIICDGRTFIAGADISEFGKPPAPPSLHDALNAMENASKPVIAAIHGTALGGGFEVALTAHYRIAVPSAKCALPEIKLGIIPGAGGTQRLPRLIGAEKALEIILSGTPFGAREAKEWGVVDELAEEGKLRESALRYAKRLIAEKAPLKKVRDRSDKLELARGHPEIFEASRKANARKFRGFEAWEKAIESVKNAVDLPFDEGMDR